MNIVLNIMITTLLNPIIMGIHTRTGLKEYTWPVGTGVELITGGRI